MEITTMVKASGCCPDDGDGTQRKTAASKIFDTAKDLFYKRGVRAVGVDEIVCEAGVTKPSLYRAYKSKDDLVAACLKDNVDEGRHAIYAAMDAVGPCPADRLHALIRHYAGKIGGVDFRGCPISNVAIELPEPGHPGRAIVENCKTEFRATVSELTRGLGVCDPDSLADGIVLVIEGAMATHHVFGSQGPALALIDTCDALIEAHRSKAKA